MWINLTDEERDLITTTLRAYAEEDDSSANLADRIEKLSADQADPVLQSFRGAAEGRYLCHPWTDGDVDIDDDAFVSDSEEGAYVMGWFWVTNERAGIEEADDA